MSTSLRRVLSAVHSRTSAQEWRDSLPAISAERDVIERMLMESPARRVYGFTTRLGHEDSISMTPQEQTDVLLGHLIGPADSHPSVWRTLLIATKLEQTFRGGTGVHPQTYQVLVNSLASERNIVGNWRDTYSCGDVVSGAWMVADLLESEPDLLMHRGDLIALINGNFPSTAASIVAASRLLSAIEPMLVAYGRMVHASSSRSQAPVSLRDEVPVMAAIHRAVQQLGRGIEARLRTMSGNPLFLFDSAGEVEPRSQSSFLDYELSFALTNCLQSVSLCAGIWQRMIYHRCRDGAVLKGVQAPKVAQGLVERIRAHATLPLAFSGNESEGIEDLRDLSSIAAWMLYDEASLLARFEAIWRDIEPEGEPTNMPESSDWLAGAFFGGLGADVREDYKSLIHLGLLMSMDSRAG